MGQDPQTNVPLFILCALKLSDLYIFVPSCARRNPPTGRRVSSPGRLPSSRSVKNHSAIFCNMLHHYLCSLIISKLFDHFDRFSMLWPRDALLIAFEQSPVPFSRWRSGLPILRAAVCCLEVPTVMQRYAETICCWKVMGSSLLFQVAFEDKPASRPRRQENDTKGC